MVFCDWDLKVDEWLPGNLYPYPLRYLISGSCSCRVISSHLMSIWYLVSIDIHPHLLTYSLSNQIDNHLSILGRWFAVST
jgi:hypothetical protein